MCICIYHTVNLGARSSRYYIFYVRGESPNKVGHAATSIGETRQSVVSRRRRRFFGQTDGPRASENACCSVGRVRVRFSRYTRSETRVCFTSMFVRQSQRGPRRHTRDPMARESSDNQKKNKTPQAPAFSNDFEIHANPIVV